MFSKYYEIIIVAVMFGPMFGMNLIKILINLINLILFILFICLMCTCLFLIEIFINKSIMDKSIKIGQNK